MAPGPHPRGRPPWAPAAVRDLHDKDAERIIVEGDEAYNEARNFAEDADAVHTAKGSRITRNNGRCS